MSLFDTNLWYSIYTKNNSKLGLHGSNLNGQGKGAVFFTDKTTGDAQLWQFYQIEVNSSSSYVIRNKGTGGNAYLVATQPNGNPPENILGNTVPALANSNLIDNSMFWQATPWNDGTFYFTNSANGTAWHLQFRPDNTTLAMSSDITAGTRDVQSYSWQQQTNINNQTFSTIDVGISYFRSSIVLTSF